HVGPMTSSRRCVAARALGGGLLRGMPVKRLRVLRRACCVAGPGVLQANSMAIGGSRSGAGCCNGLLPDTVSREPPCEYEKSWWRHSVRYPFSYGELPSSFVGDEARAVSAGCRPRACGIMAPGIVGGAIRSVSR